MRRLDAPLPGVEVTADGQVGRKVGHYCFIYRFIDGLLDAPCSDIMSTLINPRGVKTPPVTLYVRFLEGCLDAPISLLGLTKK